MANIPGTNIPDIPVTDWDEHLSDDITAFLAADHGDDVRNQFVDMAQVIANVILKQANYVTADLTDGDVNAAARAKTVGDAIYAGRDKVLNIPHVMTWFRRPDVPEDAAARAAYLASFLADMPQWSRTSLPGQYVNEAAGGDLPHAETLATDVTYVIEKTTVGGLSANPALIYTIRSLGGTREWTGYVVYRDGAYTPIVWFMSQKVTDETLSEAGYPADAAAVGDLLYAGDEAERSHLYPSIINHDRIVVPPGSTFDVRELGPMRKLYYTAGSLSNLPDGFDDEDSVAVLRYPINYVGNVSLFVCYNYNKNKIWFAKYIAPSGGGAQPELKWRDVVTGNDLGKTYTFTRNYEIGSISPISGIVSEGGSFGSMLSGPIRNRVRRYGIYADAGYEICIFAYKLENDALVYVGMWDGEKYAIPDEAEYHFFTTIDRAALDNAYEIRILARKADGSSVSIDDTGCAVMFEDNSDVERMVYTNLKRLKGWLNAAGNFYDTPYTQTHNVSHSEKIPVRPCHRYYVGIPYESVDQISVDTIGCCYDSSGKFLKAVLKSELEAETYPRCDLTPVTFEYKTLFSFMTPPECAYFARNLFGASYVQTLTDMPIHPLGGSGNYTIRADDPAYQKKRNKKLVLIGPSTLSIDGMKRTVVTAQSSDDFCVHISGGSAASGVRYYVIKNGEGKWNTKADGSGVDLSTSLVGTYGDPQVGDTIELGTQYICGLQQYLYPWYKDVYSVAYSGSKTAHHAGTDGPTLRANGGWDYVVGDRIDLSDYDEMVLFLNTQQSILANEENSEYKPEHPYAKNAYVYKEGMIWKANKATTGDWKPGDWDVQEFSEDVSYPDGSYLTRDGYCYVCRVANGHQGAWSNDDFDPVAPMGTANTTDVKTTIGATMDIVRYYVEQRGLKPSIVYLRINAGNFTNALQERYSEEIRKFAEAGGYRLIVNLSRGSDYLGNKSLLYDGTHSNNAGNRNAGENLRKELLGF